MVTLAAIFPPMQPPEQIRPVAAAAESAGLAQLWVWEDCFKESGIATATAMLATTSQVGIAIGLLPVPLRNVALTAMEIATLARLFPGRLTAGIGHGVLGWMGQVGARVESPMTLLREYTTALSALLSGETVTVQGRYVHLDEVALDWPPAEVPPLLVGGIRPRTVALAGELSDGVIIPSEPSAAFSLARTVPVSASSAISTSVSARSSPEPMPRRMTSLMASCRGPITVSLYRCISRGYFWPSPSRSA